MRPCQHCGSAILPKETVCPKCQGEQAATVGGDDQGSSRVAAPSDALIVEGQIRTIAEGENWLKRAVFSLCLSVYLVQLLLSYYAEGTEGMLGVSAAMAVAGLLIFGAFAASDSTTLIVALTIGGLIVIFTSVFTLKSAVEEFSAHAEQPEAHLWNLQDNTAGRPLAEMSRLHGKRPLTARRGGRYLFSTLNFHVSRFSRGLDHASLSALWGGDSAETDRLSSLRLSANGNGRFRSRI